MGKAVGIDLGTTFSEVAVLEAGEPVVVTSAEGSRLVPSVVAISKNGERLVVLNALWGVNGESQPGENSRWRKMLAARLTRQPRDLTMTSAW